MNTSNTQNNNANNNGVGNYGYVTLSQFLQGSSYIVNTQTLIKWTDAEFSAILAGYNATVNVGVHGVAPAYEPDSPPEVIEFINRQTENLRHYKRLGVRAPHIETLHSTMAEDLAQYRSLRATRLRDLDYLVRTGFDIQRPHEHPINDDRNPNIALEVATVRSILFTHIEKMDDMIEVLIPGMKIIEKAIMSELKCCLQDDLRAVYVLAPLREMSAHEEIRALGKAKSFDLTGLRNERQLAYRKWNEMFRTRFEGHCPRCDIDKE